LSTSTSTLAAGNYVQVEFVCTDLLTAPYDRAFIKLVPAGGGGCATSGVGDAVAGATCELALKTAGVATAGVCAMTIDPNVAASTANEWCFHAGSSSAGLYQSTTTPSFATTTAQLMWSSPDGAIDVWWSFPAAGKTFFTVKCKKLAGSDGWCAFGVAPTQPVTMNAISSAVWNRADGSLKEYDLTAQSDPVTGGMLASVAAIESSNLYPGAKTFSFTCANKIGAVAVSGTTNHFAWAYKPSGGWGEHSDRDSATVNLAVAPTSAPTKAPTAPTSAPTIAPGTVPTTAPTMPTPTKFFDSPDGSISLAWSTVGGKTTFAVTCNLISASGDGWCSFGIGATSPSTMAASSAALWDLTAGTVLEYDMTAAADPVPSMRAATDGIESYALSPSTRTFAFTCSRIGLQSVNGVGNNFLVWAYKPSGGWGYHGAANRACVSPANCFVSHAASCYACLLSASPSPSPSSPPPPPPAARDARHHCSNVSDRR